MGDQYDNVITLLQNLFNEYLKRKLISNVGLPHNNNNISHHHSMPSLSIGDDEEAAVLYKRDK